MTPRAGRIVLVAAAAAAAVVAGMTGAGIWAWRGFTEPGPAAHDVTLVIPRGAGVGGIAGRLEDAGAISDARLFEIGVRLSGADRSLRAGEYVVRPGASMAEIMADMRAGRVLLHRLTVPEGLTSEEIVSLIGDEALLDGEIAEIPPEGSLLPETYHFARGEKRDAVIDRMGRAMTETLDALWPGRAEDLPFSDRGEAVILASIVEKETAIPNERAHIAAVFINRLKRGMRLQSDPTALYGLEQQSRTPGTPARRADIERDTPHNTYRIGGLPPTPIANPGRAAILAVLHPSNTRDLYFVADGTGGHAFAETLEEHNRNVRRWRRVRGGG